MHQNSAHLDDPDLHFGHQLRVQPPAVPRLAVSGWHMAREGKGNPRPKGTAAFCHWSNDRAGLPTAWAQGSL
jgi:hypothetical protein